MIESKVSRRQFITGGAAVLAIGALSAMFGCAAPSGTATGSANSGKADAPAAKKITMVWLPDNSAADLTPSREAFGEVIKKASGAEVELMTTTDYNVAIEAIASGKVQMALLGAEGYVQANKKNAKVLAAFTNSDSDGGLEGARYYSRICVRKEDADKYKDGSKYSIKNIKGKSFSFVTNTSTSGFKVPSAGIVKEFNLESNEQLLEGGKFFSEVIFGGSHVGSVVNLLSGACEAAAFDDVDVDMHLDLVSGEANSVGAVYKAKDNAEAPFDTVRGKEFVIISITAVLNAPFVFNHDAIDDETRKKIVDLFTSKEVADNKKIFVGKEEKGIFKKSSEKSCFVTVSDDWYEPIRKLSK